MTKEIVLIYKDEPRVSSWDIKDGFGFKDDHRYVTRMIEKYKTDFEDFGVVAIQRQQPVGEKGGRPIDAFLLNEQQAMFLGTLFRNTPMVIKFKKALIKQFDKQKKLLSELAAQRQNVQWLETRNSGKKARRVETDAIKKFVDYATDQGSKSASLYYKNISDMENKALFFIEQKFKNIRDNINLHQLSTLSCADVIVEKAIIDGMDLKLHYKDIYKLAKQRVESFADLHGKTLIPAPLKQIASTE